MNPSIPTGLIPPLPGLEREEPELAHEDDIPADDGTLPPDTPAREDEEQPERQIERE